MRSSISGAYSRKRGRSLERMPNWYCARVWVVPMLIDWTGWKKMLMPGTVAVARRRRAITCRALSLRSGLSRSMMNMRPEFTVLAALPPPTVDITETTSGSRLMISASADCRATMASNEASSGPTVEPVSWPISSDGKKPLGIAWNRMAVSTKVPSVMASTMPRHRHGALQRPGIAVGHLVEAPFEGAAAGNCASRDGRSASAAASTASASASATRCPRSGWPC